MELKHKLFAILAIFCVLGSACAVCAAGDGDGISANGTVFIDGSSPDGAIIPPDNTHDEARHAAGADPYLDGSQDGHNGTIIPPDYAHNESAMMNATNSTGNSTHAAGSDAVNSTGNATNATAHNALPATGNPIIALFVGIAAVGGYAALKRKN
jgi:hypothetical protein